MSVIELFGLAAVLICMAVAIARDVMVWKRWRRLMRDMKEDKDDR